MDDQFPADEDTTEVTKARHSRTNKVLATLLGLFGVVGPVVSAYISYRQAKVESSSEIKTAHAESEAGYQAVSSPLNQILPIVVQMAGEIAQLKVEVAALRAQMPMTPSQPTPTITPPPLQLHGLRHVSMAVGKPVADQASADVDGDGIKSADDDASDESPAALRPLLRPLPKSLHEAAQQVEAK